MVVKTLMLYDLDTVALTKRQEAELKVVEVKILMFSFEVTRTDIVRSKYIRGIVMLDVLERKVREARLSWFGHVQRRDGEYVGIGL